MCTFRCKSGGALLKLGLFYQKGGGVINSVSGDFFLRGELDFVRK